MDQLDPQIQARDDSAIPEFRNIHKSAILINLCQLVVIVGSLAAL
jgi:hypothetical protein